ncbi:MAG: hypothetical protein KDC28_04270 [Saprospiraceae bacterium]|nr:hypothetical protein [Saprospiraceae bacterium]MCB9319217.1 hypothetical protein [Lewinellaceae bacterium]
MIWSILLFIKFLFPGNLYLNDVPVVFTDTISVRTIDRAADQQGYYLYLPERAASSYSVVLFVHGYGCINPMIYGAWIRHLVSQGNVVIYPRYQESIWTPSPRMFALNVAHAFSNAIELMDSLHVPYRLDQLAYVGHSYGGTTVAYLGVYHDSLDMPAPRVIMACQPGTGPFDALKLESYAGIDPAIKLLVLVGKDDKTVGDALGRQIFSTAQVPYKRFVEHLASEDELFTASHYEPEGLDMAFDNGDRNVSAKRALRLAKLDAVDTLYWDLFDHTFQTDSLSPVWELDSVSNPFPIEVK